MSGVTRYVTVLMGWLAAAVVLNALGLTSDSALWWLLVAPPAIVFALTLAGGLVLCITCLLAAFGLPTSRPARTRPLSPPFSR